MVATKSRILKLSNEISFFFPSFFRPLLALQSTVVFYLFESSRV